MNSLRRHYRTIVLVWGGLGVAMWFLRPRAPYLREGVYAAWVLLTVLWLVLALQSWPPYMRAPGRLRSWAKRRGEQGQYRISYGTLLAVEALGARDGWSLGHRGYLADLLGDVEKAKALYEKALNLDATQSATRSNLLYLLLNEGAVDEAAGYAEPLSVLENVDPATIGFLAWELVSKDPSKALKVSNLARRAGDEDAAVFAEAAALLELGRADEALAVYRGLYEDTRDPLMRMLGRHGIVWVHGSEGRFSQALDIAEDALLLAREVPSGTAGLERHTKQVQKTIARLKQGRPPE